MSNFYVIWSLEHLQWWGPFEVGYTPDVWKAGRYDRERALQVCKEVNPNPCVPTDIIMLEKDAVECFGKRDEMMIMLEKEEYSIADGYTDGFADGWQACADNHHRPFDDQTEKHIQAFMRSTTNLAEHNLSEEAQLAMRESYKQLCELLGEKRKAS